MRRRVRRYAWLMGACLLLFGLSAPVASLFGAGWGIAMCAVAAVIPPVAVIIANSSDPDDPRDHDARFGPNAE
ncbi:DUF3099 domain-containing protein [Actinorugispora endophytica]|uniref:DUF3099 family protein n=1 Tax=Actinorugispora endophytica TaxID=1605990 RepID=A0A4R6UXK2_9ACTN|nr:DUF3099 domain-containing protein [Actinorugispora endophytica]TDQ50305.1 DUF3099 family protein [Actinorugispora endophytica]